MVNAMQINVGDTVRLAPEITVEEFGLSLCDDDGTPIEIDAEVLDVGKVYLRVKIMRMMRLTRLTAPQEMAVTRFVRPNHVLDVLDVGSSTKYLAQCSGPEGGLGRTRWEAQKDDSGCLLVRWC